MSQVLAILETLPTADELRAEREQTGEGMMAIKDRHQKKAMLDAIAAATSMDDVKVILARVVERCWR